MMPLAALCFVWSGMVLGISFLEAPVKFTAPSVTLPVGLDVGRHVFGAFNKVELGWTFLSIVLVVWTRSERAVWLPLAGAALIVALQTFWLLPLLHIRVEMILNEQSLPPATYHIAYVALELLKLAGLVTAGTACLWALKQAAPMVP
jgi:hypothetical protein